ncbi:TetR/AcrR family transcriptional regulator [Streptomyces sp. NPDC057638]|uniref:TetR/AcrR family transcriptional regulator n=1 Tax=Streptomyces sp. NPDC057638 TaxID=3346190 RepID=UPI0036CC85A9
MKTHAPTEATARERALELLWGDTRRGSRGPERGLTLERIVAVAIEVAQEEGLAAMSMRRVASRLGIGTASLYTYLPGRAELEALMLDAVITGSALPHERPGDWRAKLAAWARDDWESVLRHPWVLQLHDAERVPGPNMLRWLDSALRVFDGTALTEPEKLAAIESVDAYVRGLARLRMDRAAGAAGSRAERGAPEGVPEDTSTRERDDALVRLVDFDRFPALQRALAQGAVPYAADRFDFGLQRLLDGIERLVDTRGLAAGAPAAGGERRPD